MRRISSNILAVFLVLIVSLPVSALDWGFRGGLNLVDNNLNNISASSLIEKDSYTGFYVGPMFQFSLPLGFGIDVSAVYSQKGFNLTADETIKEQAVSVPLMARYQLSFGNVIGFFLQAGPQVNFNLGNLSTAIKDRNASVVLNRAVWNFDVGAGIELFNHLQFALNYNLPLSDDGSLHTVMEDITSKDSFNSSTLQLMFSYKF